MAPEASTDKETNADYTVGMKLMQNHDYPGGQVKHLIRQVGNNKDSRQPKNKLTPNMIQLFGERENKRSKQNNGKIISVP